jgi:hypothetical protein
MTPSITPSHKEKRWARQAAGREFGSFVGSVTDLHRDFDDHELGEAAAQETTDGGSDSAVPEQNSRRGSGSSGEGRYMTPAEIEASNRLFSVELLYAQIGELASKDGAGGDLESLVLEKKE